MASPVKASTMKTSKRRGPVAASSRSSAESRVPEHDLGRSRGIGEEAEVAPRHALHGRVELVVAQLVAGDGVRRDDPDAEADAADPQRARPAGGARRLPRGPQTRGQPAGGPEVDRRAAPQPRVGELRAVQDARRWSARNGAGPGRPRRAR